MFKKGALILSLLFIATIAHAQTADQVYDQYLDFNLARLKGETNKAMLIGESLLPNVTKLQAKSRTTYYAGLAKLYEDSSQQGFKLALDSLTAKGYNYKLQVYDTRDLPSQSHSLAYNPDIRASDLIVGPVFPEGIKAFTSVLTSARKPILSPLAASAPSTFKNQNLVTAIPPLEYHAWAAADYVVNDIKAKKVFILKSGYSVDNEYINPFKKGVDSLSKKQVKTIAQTVTRGNLKTIEPQFSLTEQNVFVVPSTNQAFLSVTLRTLDSLSKKYPITVFGHPSWGEVSFLKAELLQNLKTHITSSNNIDYKADATLEFTRNYRKTFKAEASEYSIKGFDEGMYFGNLLGKDNDGLKNLGENKFTGLHNSFRFVKKPSLGWINTYVNVLKYSNFALKQVK